MKIQSLTLHPYKIPLTQGQPRQGVLVRIIDEKGQSGWGDVAPLPKWSQETLEEALDQLHKIMHDIINIDWTARHWFEHLKHLNLLPSVSFGLESALLSILLPLPEHTVPAGALLMGTPEEILNRQNSVR